MQKMAFSLMLACLNGVHPSECTWSGPQTGPTLPGNAALLLHPQLNCHTPV